MDKPLKANQFNAFKFMVNKKSAAVVKNQMQLMLEKKIVDDVAQQSLKLAQQEKEALDKLMNDVKDLVKD
jgi:hypothetical protein